MNGSDNLVLSLFPGLDLLGRGFEAAGYCVVRGPDKILGGDIRNFHTLRNRFDGVIGGPPCQDFSKLRRTPPTGYGLEMLSEFCRVVTEAHPYWFVMENVPTVPDVTIPGYKVQRLDLLASEFGLPQKRVRHFQFVYPENHPQLIVPRHDGHAPVTEPAAVAREGSSTKARGWERFCALQGVTALDLPDFNKRGKYKLVGNGVAFPVANALAEAIKAWPLYGIRGCACGCGRVVVGNEQSAGPACRKRLERSRRDNPPPALFSAA